MHSTSLVTILALFLALLSARADEVDARIFHAFDLDHDQCVTYFEYAHRMRESFRRMDHSEDKALTFTEHERYQGAEADLHDPFTLAGFEELDRNKDRIISQAEYAYAVGMTFAAADGAEGDRDERVTLAEYLVAMNRARASALRTELFHEQLAQAQEKQAETP